MEIISSRKNSIEKPYQWWLTKDGAMPSRYAMVYEDIIRYGPELSSAEGKRSLDSKVMGNLVYKKVLMDLLHIQIIINHLREVFHKWGHDTSFEILYHNIFKKMDYWLWKESGVCHVNVPPWQVEGGFQNEPDHFLLSKMSGRQKDRVLKSLDRNTWLSYLPIQDLIRHFGYEGLLKPKVEVTSHKIGNKPYGHERTRNKILVLLKDPMNHLRLAAKLKLNTASTKRYLRSLMVEDKIKCNKDPAEWFDKDSFFYVDRNTPKSPDIRPRPRIGDTSILTKPKVTDLQRALDTKRTEDEDQAPYISSKLLKKTAKLLDKLAKDDEVGILQKHVFIFLGQTKRASKKEPIKRKATFLDVAAGLAKSEDSEITIGMYPQEAKRGNDVINTLFCRYHKFTGKPVASHPVYQKFVLLYPEGLRKKRTGQDHWIFSGGRNPTGIDSEPIAKWLLTFFPEATNLAIKRLEKLQN